MKDSTKNIALVISVAIAVMLSIIVGINTFTNRSWDDAIIKAETHHLITGEYYNKYSKILAVVDSDTVISYRVYKLANFEKTYWDKIEEMK